MKIAGFSLVFGSPPVNYMYKGRELSCSVRPKCQLFRGRKLNERG